MGEASTSTSIRKLVVLKQPAVQPWGLFDNVPDSLLKTLPSHAYRPKTFVSETIIPTAESVDHSGNESIASSHSIATEQSVVEQPSAIPHMDVGLETPSTERESVPSEAVLETPEISFSKAEEQEETLTYTEESVVEAHVKTQSSAKQDILSNTLQTPPITDPLPPVEATPLVTQQEQQNVRWELFQENHPQPFQANFLQPLEQIPGASQRWELFETRTSIASEEDVKSQQTNVVTDESTPVNERPSPPDLSHVVIPENMRWELFAEQVPKPFERAQWQKVRLNGKKRWGLFDHRILTHPLKHHLVPAVEESIAVTAQEIELFDQKKVLLVFESGKSHRFALPLSQIDQMVETTVAELTPSAPPFRHQQQIVELFDLAEENWLLHSSLSTRVTVILYRYGHRWKGVLATRIIDVVKLPSVPQTVRTHVSGVIGNVRIQGEDIELVNMM